jgi:fibronectin-binding autotransporter adhesin
VVNVPITLSSPLDTPVTVDWETLETSGPGEATAGADFVAGSGTVTFAPGQTSQTVPITVFGDTIDEPPALYGEFGFLEFSNPSTNATLDTTLLHDLGIFIIIDDD